MPVQTHRERHRVGPVEIPDVTAFTRADLEVYGINHFRPSFTVHVYLNAPDTDDLDPSHASYAGSFSIFGHQRCAGDEGHCEVHEHLRRFDDRPSHPLTRAFKRVIVTDALRRILDGGNREVTVTFVLLTAGPVSAGEALLDYQGLQIATFD
jgi:hypothetical protein